VWCGGILNIIIDVCIYGVSRILWGVGGRGRGGGGGWGGGGGGGGERPFSRSLPGGSE